MEFAPYAFIISIIDISVKSITKKIVIFFNYWVINFIYGCCDNIISYL